MNPFSLAIIDDEKGFCDFVERVAVSVGYEVAATTDIDDFIRHVRMQTPTLIMLDLRMPGMDGVELLRELATMGLSGQILIASGVEGRVTETALRLGRERGLNMAGVIAKPVRAQTLRATLERLKPVANDFVSVSALEAAIRNTELVLHYQPQIDLSSGLLIGVEALVRWAHPERGIIPPGAFIPVAESSGLIVPLTDLVLNLAIGQAQAWQRDGLELAVAVNLSAAILTDYNLPDRLEGVCRSHGIDPARFTLELTETAAMRDAVRLMDILTRFRLKGFQVAIDDFGTGYSSLVQLHRLPFSEMKVDKSFVAAMCDNSESLVIVKTIVGMAHNLSLRVVAEGVESREALDTLRELRCDLAQGFLISRPVTPDRIPEFSSAAFEIADVTDGTVRQ